MTDVVVLGGGCTGLFTAIAARLQGLTCLVLEAALKLGGGRILETPPVDATILGDWADRVAVPVGPLHRLGASELGRLGGANSQAAWDAALALERDRPSQRGLGAGLMAWLVAVALKHGV